MTQIRRPRVQTRTQVLSRWRTSDLEALRSDLKADPTLGGNMRADRGYSWLASINAVLSLRTASETTDGLF